MLKLKNLLIIGITILISSCGGTTINFNEEKEYLEERKKIVYYKGTPFSGTILKYQPNEFNKSELEKLETEEIR